MYLIANDTIGEYVSTVIVSAALLHLRRHPKRRADADRHGLFPKETRTAQVSNLGDAFGVELIEK